MLLKFHEWCAQMSSKDVGHVVHNSRPAVKGFAEFRCSPVRGEDTEASESIQKVNCTKLQYTYPLKLLVPSQASAAPSCLWLYVITFGGGLVEGDNVSVDLNIGENCTVVVTTQASTKVYNSEEGLVTRQGLRGLVADGGLLAVLPDPVVCFKNAIYSQQQDFELSSNGNVVILDWFSAGRVAVGEVWDMTSYKSHNRVFVDGKLVYGDSISLSNGKSLTVKDSMCGSVVLGSCVFVGPYFKEIKKRMQEKVCELTKLKEMNSSKKEIVAYSSVLDSSMCDGVVVRLITTQSTEQAYMFFRTVIEDIVPKLGGHPLIK